MGIMILAPSILPNKIAGLIGWYDAADLSAVNTGGAIADNTTITVWKDKSGQGNDLTNVGSPKFRLAVQNGLSIVRLNGSTDSFFKTSPAGYNVSDITVLVVNKRTGVTGGSSAFAHFLKVAYAAAFHTATVKANRIVEYDSNGLTFQNFNDSSAVTLNATVTGPAAGNSKCYGVRFSNSGTNKCTVKQGQLPATARGSITGFTNAAATALDIGCLPANAGRTLLDAQFNGDIFEILIYNSALSDKDFNSAAIYLKNKWGI